MSVPEIDPVLGGAREIRQTLAGVGLTPAIAKLYSQHTRLSNGQRGLTAWSDEETRERLHDAMRLTSAALVERAQGADGWQQSLRRAGEILEWLSHPQLNPRQLPLIFMASAAYQLAGYPARSAGLLNQGSSENASQILYYFLSGNFKSLLDSLRSFWVQGTELIQPLPWRSDDERTDAIHNWITVETASAMGVLCSFFRWGDESRTKVALDKLSAVADLFLNGSDSYSWLLAKLCAEVAVIYYQTSLRTNLTELSATLDENGRKAIDLYERISYLYSKTVAWPSQLQGIHRLIPSNSFALCTPTGSGKTTIAEIAIIQSLFGNTQIEGQSDAALNGTTNPLVLYLVPSRALAAEVEAKLGGVLTNIAGNEVQVTGLYGGIDWGPTDAWLTTDERTVLICTYEKAEAMLRFIGPLFLSRVSLIIIDEAHNVQYEGDVSRPVNSENRSLRLESLVGRLLSQVSLAQVRIIALSAVSVGFENALSEWITGGLESGAVRVSYRSTRQLIGRLECFPSGGTTIHYDLLDGADLAFSERGESSSPFIPSPFPPCRVPTRWTGPEKRVRPHLFWTAIHLARTDQEVPRRGVLISVMQQIGGYAEDFLALLNDEWPESEQPVFFQIPRDSDKFRLWQQCLSACEDYFTFDSYEYQLLEKGIVLHHGKMPGILARLLAELINERIVHLVLATSTLSEGVNLPFETVLIPSILRNGSSISVGEFRNLVGRAGRPGYGTEGRSLIILPPRNERRLDRAVQRAYQRYDSLVSQLIESPRPETLGQSGQVRSSLALLLSQIEQLWSQVSGTTSRNAFLNWLEQTAPTENNVTQLDEDSNDGKILLSLDTLDSVLLSAIVEMEQVSEGSIGVDELEERLQRVWRRTYAYVATHDESSLQETFIRRGVAVRTHIYPDADYRRRLYKTSLPPMSGAQLLNVYSDLIPHLRSGNEYANWSLDERFEFVQEIVARLSTIRQFRLNAKAGRHNVEWSQVLRWWLDPSRAPVRPNRKQISDWHNYVSQNFQYRFNWGLGCMISLAMDEAHHGQLRLPALDEWPQTQLPWIVFWTKELVTWGTLDPVAAYLLSSRVWITRQDAEGAAKDYYEGRLTDEPNDMFNALTIRSWVEQVQRTYRGEQAEPRWPHKITVELLRDFAGSISRRFRVIPISRNGKLRWFDPAGFPLAESERLNNWEENFVHEYDFYLDPEAKLVTSQLYLV